MDNFTKIRSNMNLYSTGLVAKYKPLLNCTVQYRICRSYHSFRDDEK
jgi:hypothetical protein